MAQILIADDEPKLGKLVVEMLTAAGHHAAHVAGGKAAVEWIKSTPPDIVITDLRMPDIDGVELLRRLRVDGAMLPAIVVTGHGDVQMAVEAMKNGAMDFIEKPFSDEVLLESIHHAVERVATAADNEDIHRRTRERLATLSERELQVLKGVVQGQPNKVIAYELGLSPRTVEVYRSSLMSKMQVKSLADLVRMIMGIDLDTLGGPAA